MCDLGRGDSPVLYKNVRELNMELLTFPPKNEMKAYFKPA